MSRRRDRSAPGGPARVGSEGGSRGGVTLPVLAVVLLAVAGAAALARWSSAVVDVARASAVADAVALAAARGGPGAARSVALRNGAVVEVLTVGGPVTSVGIRLGGVRASARATVRVTPVPGAR